MEETKTGMAAVAKAVERSTLRLVPGDPNTISTLTEQLTKMETIGRAMREKIQSEKMALLQEHDRKWTEIQHTYARRIHEETRRLEQERDVALRELQDAYFEKSRDLDKVALRLND